MFVFCGSCCCGCVCGNCPELLLRGPPATPTNTVFRSFIDAAIAAVVTAGICVITNVSCVRLSFMLFISCWVASPCYRRVQFVQSIRHCAHLRLQGCKLLLHRTVRVWKAGPDYTVLLPVVIRKSHSVCLCHLVSSLVHIPCIFLDQFQFLCALQNFTKITICFIFIQFLLEPRVKKPF